MGPANSLPASLKLNQIQNQTPIENMKLMTKLCRLSVLLLAFAGLSLQPAPANEPAPTQAATVFEVNFMTGMIHHHLMGVEMAEICLENAVTPELETLCHSIIEVQTAEAETMINWLSDWYGIEYEAKPKPGQMKAMARLAELTGAAFEIEFMEMMIRHHAAAIREAGHCERRGYHEALKDLCASIAESQAEEIELMESWLCDWYDECH